MKTTEYLLKAIIQPLLALIIVIGGLVAVIFFDLKETVESRIFDLMFLIVGFYYVSSVSGAKKDETIANQLDK